MKLIANFGLWVLLLSLFSSCKVQEYPYMNLSNVSWNKTPVYYTDKYDNMAFRQQYQEGRQYSNGLAAVKLDDRWGFIDAEGKVAIPMEYTWVSSFGEYGLDEDYALAKTGEIDKFAMPVMQEGPAFLINTKGERVTPVYGDITPSGFDLLMMNDGTGKFDVIGKHFAKSNGKWGYINNKGKEVVKCKYDIVYPFRDIITFVQNDGKWGCINRSGKEIIPCRYDEVYYKSDHLDVNTPFDLAGMDNLSRTEVAKEKNIIYMVKDGKVFRFNTKGKLLAE